MTKAQADVIDEAVREFNANTKVLQIEKHYSTGDRFQDKAVDYLHIDHHTFTTLKLEWSLKGDWCDIPREPSLKKGPNEDLHKYWIARIEPYIDASGKTKWAASYGTSYTELTIWYDLEEIRAFFKHWSISTTPRWANIKVWINQL